MKLFDKIERDYKGLRTYTETSFDFLNRSAWPEAYEIRDLLEEWFSRYPSENKIEIYRRVRSKYGLSSAFFELLNYELLTKLGCDVSIHDRLSKSKPKKPDFLVSCYEGEQFYLESAVVRCKSDDDLAADARMSVIINAINSIRSPDFFISIIIRAIPDRQPSSKRIRRYIINKINELDYQEINDKYISGRIHDIPVWKYKEEGCVFNFRPIPKPPKLRRKDDVETVGLISEAGWPRDIKQLRRVLLRKGNKYSKLSLPYVIAVNVLSWSLGVADVVDALFGKEKLLINLEDSEVEEVSYYRELDGFWTSKSGPRYTRVSAVIITNNLTPWTINNANINVFYSPWSKKVVPSVLGVLPKSIIENNKLVQIPGKPLASVLGV